MGIRDWLGGRRAQPTAAATTPTWQVRVDGGELIVDNDVRHTSRRYPLHAARNVRVVPLTGGDHHSRRQSGWQVTLGRDDGDVLIEAAMPDWRPARTLAQQVCAASGLPLDELTAGLFRQTGLPES